jgi:hypothetical protein
MEPTPDQRPTDSDRNMNALAWEFGWRRRLNLVFDEAKHLDAVKEIALKAKKVQASPTQINHIAQMAVNASTWSSILNYLNKQMSKDDRHHDQNKQAEKNQWWMQPLQLFLEKLEKEARIITCKALDSAHAPDFDDYQKQLRNQEATLILFRGMLERFAGYALYLKASYRKADRHE